MLGWGAHGISGERILGTKIRTVLKEESLFYFPLKRKGKGSAQGKERSAGQSLGAWGIY